MLPATNSTAAAQTELPEAHAGLGAPIEGSWIFTINLTQQGITFTALASFAAGGVFLATGSTDRLILISPLYGSWNRIRPNRFSSTTYYFVFDSTGNPVATQKANIVFRLKNRDELVGIGETDRCDLEGPNCVSIPGNFHISAKRIVPENSIELSEMLPPQ
jgi:hypothetical protein